METWCGSNITPQCLEGLIYCGLLCPLTVMVEWWLSGDEDEPSPPEGYVVSFALFHERGFAVPAHKFLRGLLDYY
jgi:polyferredoxin